LILISITIRVLLEIFHQKWITTASHTATLVFLPILTYVITNVISGNIALSLGMVGALSIVRFRNPVTSPLELSTYFASITMGIAASVSLQWLVFLVATLLLAILIMYAVYSLHHLIYIWPVLVDRLFVRDARTDYDAANTLCSNIYLLHFLRRY